VIQLLKKIKRFKEKIKLFGLYRTLKITYRNFYYNHKLSQLDLSKEHQVEVNGCKLYLVPNDQGISTELLIFNTHEPLHTHLIKKEIKDGMICFDVGSNIGYYASLESRLVGDKGQVICIEPSPINFRYLEKNMKLQNYHNTKTYNFACGDKDGNIKFLVSDSSNWSRVLKDESAPINDKTIKVITIPIKKIDSFLDENPQEKIDTIRMDIEGYEFHAFQGMRKIIEQFKPMLIIEFHKIFLGDSITRDFLLELKKSGYETKYFIPRQLDNAKIGSIKDVKRFGIEKLLQKLDDKLLPGVFTLFLSNSRTVK